MKVENEFNIELDLLEGRTFFVEGEATHDVGIESGDYYQPPASWCDLEKIKITQIQIFSEDGEEIPCSRFIWNFVVKYYEDEITSKIEEFFDGFDFFGDFW